MLAKILRLITSVFHRLFSVRYRQVKNSGFFDKTYYLTNNPDIATSGIEPLVHYLQQGFAENRRPGTLFDQQYYNRQVRKAGVDIQNPLLHYLEIGRLQDLRPNIFVDSEYYRVVNPEYVDSTTDPLTHFLRESDNLDPECSPSPYFSTRFYCYNNADAQKHAHDPRAAYLHFLKSTAKENRQPSVYFDTAYYIDKNPKLVELGLDPFSHYGTHGTAEMKSPSPLFDPIFYASTYHISDCDDLFAHFLRHSLQEDRRPCSWFDPMFYRKAYLDEFEESELPLKHFLEVGRKKQNYPNSVVANLAEKPVISILVPVYNVKESYLNICIRSVLYQSYPHWELCLVDDCSTDTRIRPLLDEWATVDPRIKVGSLNQNSGIAAATNTAARLASGNYIAFLDNDDELTPEALQTFATWINRHHADLYYSDEDLIGDDGRQFGIFRKPDFNKELLLCHNYVNHCVLTKKSLFEKVGGCVDELNGAQDHDLILKLSEASETTIHIPQILYHWRASATSTSINHQEKHYANEAGRKSVADAIARRNEKGIVKHTDLKFFYRVARHIEEELSVTLVINWEKAENTITDWLIPLLKTAGFMVSQLIIMLPHKPSDTLAFSISEATGIDVVCRRVSNQFGPTTQLHRVLSDINCDLVTFVSGDLQMRSSNWLAALVEYGQSSQYGIISGKVDYPSEHYDLISSIPNCSSTSALYYRQFLTNSSVFMNGRHCSQQVLVANSDLFLIRRDLLQNVHSNNPTEFPFLFYIADISLQLSELGKKNIYTPHTSAITAVNEVDRYRNWSTDVLLCEKQRFQDKWFKLLRHGDPFYNPGLVSDESLSVSELQLWLTGTYIPEYTKEFSINHTPPLYDVKKLLEA